MRRSPCWRPRQPRLIARGVDLLTKHPAFEPIETEWTRWSALAATLELVGRLDVAEALLVALDFDCDVLTAEPALYSALGDDLPIIVI